ncbi:penicillin-binding protein [Streptomyces sp. NBC_01732]|uniref:transglycosylase domain-containing protein n=1 Tax=unclassified Streptomyces TaxID=2593676 RepID=UPI000F5BFB21|nr:transglycosylase domain-containing protein [Streptomyces sp. ADI95-17]RPK58856.1 Penicillin-binding protein 1A [Streptomyces sp. ADI95-17]WSG51515.1 penicillin-binding protein [Streptomyces sp. NBC_01732]
MARSPIRPIRATRATRAIRHRRLGIDYPRRGRRTWRRWIPSWRQVLSGVMLGAVTLAGLFAVVYASVDIPNENDEARRQGTVYYWADGSQLVSVGAVNRQNVTLADIPDSVENAVIAAENETFYSDPGVSATGIARAAVSIVKGGETQGGSTITQQYVKNTYLSQEQSATRKFKEFFISLKLNNKQGKKEILQGYLNTSWFGRGAYGIQAAANAYYGIPAKDLDPGQAALLASLLKGAEQYDPAGGKGNHERAVDRWKWILDRQVETGTMTKAERASYQKFPEPKPAAKPTSLGGQTGYLVDIANKYIKKRSGLTDKDLFRGGYRVHTTFDKARVGQLERAVRGVRKRDLDPKKRSEDKYVEVGAASVRADGAVVAVYGGADAITHFANNADTAGVPVGSAFKPFVLAAALQHGDGITLDSGYDSAGRLIKGGPYTALPTPSDAGPGRAMVTTPTPLRDALIKSSNTTFTLLGKDIGLKKVEELAVSAGLHKESLARLDKSFPLGTSTPSAVRMADAYTAFSNEGMRADPYSVTGMTRDGEKVEGFGKPEPRRAMDAAVADDVNNTLGMLAWTRLGQDGKLGTFARIKAADNLSAGATGEDDRMKSAWFIGHADGLTTAVTMFRNKPGTPQLLGMQGVGGPDSGRGNVFPLRIWNAYVTGK